MRKRRLLPAFASIFVLAGGAQLASMVLAQASTDEAVHPLIAGCEGVPEAVLLSDRLILRADRMERYLAELDRKKAEIVAAEARLTLRLQELREAIPGRTAAQRNADAQAVEDDIRRMVAIYDVMKPADAAGIIAHLPPDYAAEILMRVGAESGARIVGALDPETAAVVTAHMGARSARRN